MPNAIIERLLPPGMNRPGTAIKVRGIVSHRTGNAKPGADAQSHYNYFAGGNRSSSAHYFVDSGSILRIIPEDEMSWHAGLITNPNWTMGNPNTWAVSVELCENYPFMSPEGDMAYRKFVWLHADICRRRGLDPRKDIYGHFMVDPVNRGEDPKGLFNWSMFIEDVVRALAAMVADIQDGAWAKLAVLEAAIMDLNVRIAAVQAERDKYRAAIRAVQGIVNQFRP